MDYKNKKWQISIQELSDSEGKPIIKVTRSIPELNVSETLFFKSKKKAQDKINEWLL